METLCFEQSVTPDAIRHAKFDVFVELDDRAEESLAHIASEKGYARFGKPKRELVRYMSTVTGKIEFYDGHIIGGEEFVVFYVYRWTQRAAKLDLYEVSIVSADQAPHPSWRITVD
jgi:hypothetical protein